MDGSAPTQFYDALPALIGCIGGPELLPRLDHTLAAIAPFDTSCVFAYPPGANPIFLHDGLKRTSPPEIIRRYLAVGYLLDCVYTACKHDVGPGLYRLRELAPDAFFEGEYYNSPDIHPCISLESGSLSEEIVFLAPLPGGPYAAYSLLRRNGRPLFSEAEMTRLRAAEPQVRALLTRHWADLKPEGTAAADRTHRLEEAFRNFAADRLSARERLIVSLVLQGHSSHSIGLNLGIAEGTVKIHRKNIHAKLGISSQAQLFALFMESLDWA